MLNILIVDDEEIFLKTVVEIINRQISGLNILIAKNGKDGLEIAKNQKLQLIITDIAMPLMDGYTMADEIRKFNPEVPIIVMTAYHTQELYEKITNIDIYEYLQKPFEFNVLLRLIVDKLGLQTKATLKGINLNSILQLMEMEQKTCQMNLFIAGKKGTLYIRKGELINAATGFIKGLKAAYEILTWENPEIEISEMTELIPREINKKLMAIILESSHKNDEAQ
jgi:YesN/AraC family two-component response regulator